MADCYQMSNESNKLSSCTLLLQRRQAALQDAISSVVADRAHSFVLAWELDS